MCNMGIIPPLFHHQIYVAVCLPKISCTCKYHFLSLVGMVVQPVVHML